MTDSSATEAGCLRGRDGERQARDARPPVGQLEDSPARRDGRRELLGSGRERRHALERRECEQRNGRDEDPVEAPCRMGGHGGGQHGDGRQARDQDEQSRAEPGDEGVAPGVARELSDPPRERPRAARPRGRRARARARRAGARRGRPSGHRASSAWRRARRAAIASSTGAGRRHRRRGARPRGSARPREESARLPRRTTIEQRRARPPAGRSLQVEPLQSVDVADHPADEVAAAEALELRRRERLDAGVEPRPDAAERPERQIMGDEAVEIAGKRSREAEEANERRSSR